MTSVPRDSLLGMGDFERSAGSVAGAMMTGPWCIGPDGRPTYGALGVLLDVLVGGAISAACPPRHWPSTTEISATFSAPLPVDGTVLEARSAAIHHEPTAALAEASVRDAEGRPVALATGRFRFTPSADAPTTRAIRAEVMVPAVEPGRSLLELLDVTISESEAGPELYTPGGAMIVNPVGNVHGGISLALSIVAGLHAVQSADLPLRVTSAHIAYLRPSPAATGVRFTTKPLYRGRSLAVVQVQGVRPDGKASSIATVTSQAAGHQDLVGAAAQPDEPDSGQQRDREQRRAAHRPNL